MAKKGLLIYASGGPKPKSGGSGARELAEYALTNPAVLNAEILAFVSHHENGGVRRHAEEMKIPFIHWDREEFSAENYQYVESKVNPDLTMLSGWIKQHQGSDPRKVVNIHPGWVPGGGKHGPFGGKTFYGAKVHKATIEAFKRGEITQSAVSIHFVLSEEYDSGPLAWQMPVLIRPDDTPDSLADRVNQVERAWQSHVVNLIINDQVRLIGEPGNWKIQASKNCRSFPGLKVDEWV